MTSDDALIEAIRRAVPCNHYPQHCRTWRGNNGCLCATYLTAVLAAIRKTHAVVSRDDAVSVVASLAATISIIERTPQARKAAMSDKAFGIMLDDYTKALASGRAMLSAGENHDDQ